MTDEFKYNTAVVSEYAELIGKGSIERSKDEVQLDGIIQGIHWNWDVSFLAI